MNEKMQRPEVAEKAVSSETQTVSVPVWHPGDAESTEIPVWTPDNASAADIPVWQPESGESVDIPVWSASQDLESSAARSSDLRDDEPDRIYDVAVIGSGPAGMTAALYAARAGMDVVVFERLSPGGQMAQTEHLENYPGYVQGSSGFELALSMKQQIDAADVSQVGAEVISASLSGPRKAIETTQGFFYSRTVVIATGARPRKLGIDNEQALTGRGVSYCATCDGAFFRGKTVTVVGGGNTAVGDALYLSRICKKVYIVHRRDTFRAAAVDAKRVAEQENIEVLWNSRVVGADEDDGRLAAVQVATTDGDGGERMRRLHTDGLFVAVGTLPNTEFLEDGVKLDDAGYVIAGEDCETSEPGVFAAGDVRTKPLRQVVTAASDGAVSAEEAAHYLSV